MASVITVTLKYSDNSRSLSESYNCADTHPSPEVIKDCENQLMRKWEDMGGTYRDIQIHTKVR